MKETTTEHQINHFDTELSQLESKATHFGITPLQEEFQGSDQRERLHWLHQRFQTINIPLLKLEDHLAPHPSPTALRARQLGREMHDLYNRTKPLCREFGINRCCKAYGALYLQALCEAGLGSLVAEKFLQSLGPIVIAVPHTKEVA